MTSQIRSFPAGTASSPHAAELHSAPPGAPFSAGLEAEFRQAHLIQSRPFIRVACVLAALLASMRGVRGALFDPWDATLAIHLAVIVPGSIALAAVAWGPAFERLYMPIARIFVPLRSSLVAGHVAQAAAAGELEMLMVLPLLLIGPFFFLGFRFRTALVPVVLTVVSFVAAAVFFELAFPILARSAVLLILAASACAIGARHLERLSRTGFLENRLIAERAELDAVTGTKNRRVFEEHLTRLWQQGLADHRAIAILLIDIDHFKGYNDRYGHQAGDETLRRVAQTLQAFVRRPFDVLARYGGEEFAAILYDADGDLARDLADRMRRAVEGLEIAHRDSRTAPVVTISVGAAVIEPSADRKPRGALQLADQALYEAKRQGRNRVELMDDAAYRMLVTGIFARPSI